MQPAPPGPYKSIAITLPPRQSDASFDAFRKELAEIVNKKDRAALAGKVVAKGFFWQRAPIASDQLCYRKEDGGWKIAGYIGVGPGQD